MLAGLFVERGVRLAELSLQASVRHHLLSKLPIKHCPSTHQQCQKACQETLKEQLWQARSYHSLGIEACSSWHSGVKSMLD
jgi:hypothetical protein